MTQFIDKNKNVWFEKEHKGPIQIAEPYHTPGLKDVG